MGRGTVSGLVCALLFACGGPKPAQSSSDVKCPPGQSFDGQFCKVDQSVATVEQPLPAASAETAPPAPTSSAEPVAQVPADTASTQPGAGEGPGEVTPADAASSPVFVAPPAAAPVDYAMAAQAAPVMQYFASSHLPAGSRPVGAPFAGQFQAGQGLIKKVQLTAGKCYTIVGMGLPPVLEVNLLLVDPTDNQVLLRDETSGTQAVVGSRDQCYQATQTASFSLVLVVEQGQGVAAAQVFQK